MKAQKQKKQVAKIGLFSAVTILISAIIGIGIFFKNQSIFKANDYNPWGVLISWGLVFVIVICTGLAFVEIISSDKEKSDGGLASWAHKICGHKVGRFILIAFPMFYFSLKLIDTSFFTSEAIFNIFNKDAGTEKGIPQEMWQIMLLGIAVMITFMIINCISVRAGSYISTASTFLKFVPLLVGGLVGISLGIMNGLSHSQFSPNPDPGVKPAGNLNVLGIFSCLPALFFAFDSFLIIGNAAKSMSKPEKDIPRSIVIAIPLVAVVYMIITLGQLFTGEPTVYGVFRYFAEFIAPGNAVLATSFNVIVGIFIAISLFGVMNAFALTSLRALQDLVDNNHVVGAKWIKRKTNGNKLLGGAFLAFIMVVIYYTIICIPTIITDSDAIIDGVSNMPSLMFFGIYGLVLLYGYINHFSNKVKVTKMKSFPIIAIFAISGCFFALGYNIFYEYSVRILTDTTFKEVSWGMFKKGNGVQPWLASTIFFTFVAIFMALPFVNDWLIKLTRQNNKGQRLIWE